MKEQLYKKVYIKSEDDLPKNDYNSYWCHSIKLNRIIYILPKWKFNEIDWYLKPVELPSEEEIIKAESISTYIIKPDAKPFELLSQGFRDGINWLLNKLKQ